MHQRRREAHNSPASSRLHRKQASSDLRGLTGDPMQATEGAPLCRSRRNSLSPSTESAAWPIAEPHRRSTQRITSPATARRSAPRIREDGLCDAGQAPSGRGGRVLQNRALSELLQARVVDRVQQFETMGPPTKDQHQEHSVSPVQPEPKSTSSRSPRLVQANTINVLDPLSTHRATPTNDDLDLALSTLHIMDTFNIDTFDWDSFDRDLQIASDIPLPGGVVDTSVELKIKIPLTQVRNLLHAPFRELIRWILLPLLISTVTFSIFPQSPSVPITPAHPQDHIACNSSIALEHAVAKASFEVLANATHSFDCVPSIPGRSRTSAHTAYGLPTCAPITFRSETTYLAYEMFWPNGYVNTVTNAKRIRALWSGLAQDYTALILAADRLIIANNNNNSNSSASSSPSTLDASRMTRLRQEMSWEDSSRQELGTYLWEFARPGSLLGDDYPGGLSEDQMMVLEKAFLVLDRGLLVVQWVELRLL